jgi:hypothetical protein
MGQWRAVMNTIMKLWGNYWLPEELLASEGLWSVTYLIACGMLDTLVAYVHAEMGGQLHAHPTALTREGTVCVGVWTEGFEFGLFRNPVGS